MQGPILVPPLPPGPPVMMTEPDLWDMPPPNNNLVVTTGAAAAVAAAGADNDATAAAIWRERERRQRTIRLLMMFLMMLLLMDGEDGAQRNQNGLRKRFKRREALRQIQEQPLVYKSRIQQDQTIRLIAQKHPRYYALMERNGGSNVEADVLRYVEQQAEQQKDEFAAEASGENNPHGRSPTRQHDPDEDRTAFHYPWNVTGFYRGEWTRAAGQSSSSSSAQPGSQHPSSSSSSGGSDAVPDQSKGKANSSSSSISSVGTKLPNASTAIRLATTTTRVLDAVSLESIMLKVSQDRKEDVGLWVLPEGYEIEMRDDNNLTSLRYEDLRTDSTGKVYIPTHWVDVSSEERSGTEKESSSAGAGGSDGASRGVTLTRDSGRVAFQLFSRSVPAMKEISLVDGFVKLYDSTSQGYSTRKDILLRVRGVLIHAIGRLSLVSNVDVGRSALVLNANSRHEDVVAHSAKRRRLQESLSRVHDGNIGTIRDDALDLYSHDALHQEADWTLTSPDFGGDARRLEEERMQERTLASTRSGLENTTRTRTTADISKNREAVAERMNISWSHIVFPYPFVRDDKEETIRRTRTPAARMMPPREQALEANAAACGFEINLDIGAVEWTIGAWRNLISRRLEEQRKYNPFAPSEERPNEEADTKAGLRGSRPKPIQDQALVMNMVGSIYSPNCDFKAMLNATALRTDWDATTNKAINYSFVMMLVCLTQILILLRQLLHSQAQSAATRVSLLCIGWQTVIDAMMCLGHIYLSLAIQPLFSAFASVAFFKLFIFCVIEMKYMAIILQARGNSNGGQTADALRRQVALLHLRFYTAVTGTFVLLFYVGDSYRVFYILALYSFWVPQIILNIITEAKSPLHPHYIYGMSVTRLIAPLYIFGIRNNFLKEVYPEAPYDPLTCEALVLWVAIQTAVIVAQSKYGARFMIPARCLPPKFDYSRPIPPSMLPTGAFDHHHHHHHPYTHLPVAETMEGRDDALKGSPSLESRTLDLESSSSSSSSSVTRGRHTTTTRNRIRGRKSRGESGMTTEEHTPINIALSPVAPSLLGADAASTGAGAAVHQTLDCSICYDPIDVHDRAGYMLAPCNHLFHRDCLVQWMDVKMECPICRTDLPSL